MSEAPFEGASGEEVTRATAGETARPELRDKVTAMHEEARRDG